MYVAAFFFLPFSTFFSSAFSFLPSPPLSLSLSLSLSTKRFRENCTVVSMNFSDGSKYGEILIRDFTYLT